MIGIFLGQEKYLHRQHLNLPGQVESEPIRRNLFLLHFHWNGKFLEIHFAQKTSTKSG